MNKSVIDLAKQSGFWQEHLDTWMCSTSSLEFFANLVRNSAEVRGIEQSVKVESVTDEENEQFSNDVNNFIGADPEATKYALDRFLKRRANTADVPLLTDDVINAEATKHQLSTTEERHWYGDDYTVSVNNIKGANDFARAIEQLVRKKSGLK